MLRSRVLLNSEGAAKSFLDKFQEMQKKISDKVRGADSSRMLDPEFYRPTPKYGENELPTTATELNKKEDYYYRDRTDRAITEFKFYVTAAPKIDRNSSVPYYQQVHKPLDDVLQKLFKNYQKYPTSQAEGNIIPASLPPYSAHFDVNEPKTNPWKPHPSLIKKKKE